jgi:nucleotide-binding universal stress UspA family protein
MKGLEMALLMAKAHKAEIVGIHVIHIPFISKSELPDKILRKLKKKAEGIFLKSIKHLNQKKFSLKKKILFGDNIGRTLTTFAQKNNFDLIVIGSRGTNPHLEMFLGSVANYLLNKAKTPVLLVK